MNFSNEIASIKEKINAFVESDDFSDSAKCKEVLKELTRCYNCVTEAKTTVSVVFLKKIYSREKNLIILTLSDRMLVCKQAISRISCQVS